MGQYRISELNIEINTNSKTLLKNLQPYETTFDYKPNVVLSITDDLLLQFMEEYDGYSADEVELEYITTEYNRSLFDFNGISIRATGVQYDGCGVLFASPFEEKELYKNLPSKLTFAVNTPALRLISTEFFVYDTPFGLHGDLSKEAKLPLKSIVFVDSNRFDSLKRLDTKDMVSMFMRSVMQSIHSDRTKHTLFMLEKIMKKVTFYGVSDLSDVKFILDRVTE